MKTQKYYTKTENSLQTKRTHLPTNGRALSASLWPHASELNTMTAFTGPLGTTREVLNELLKVLDNKFQINRSIYAEGENIDGGRGQVILSAFRVLVSVTADMSGDPIITVVGPLGDDNAAEELTELYEKWDAVSAESAFANLKKFIHNKSPRATRNLKEGEFELRGKLIECIEDLRSKIGEMLDNAPWSLTDSFDNTQVSDVATRIVSLVKSLESAIVGLGERAEELPSDVVIRVDGFKATRARGPRATSRRASSSCAASSSSASRTSAARVAICTWVQFAICTWQPGAICNLQFSHSLSHT